MVLFFRRKINFYPITMPCPKVDLYKRWYDASLPIVNDCLAAPVAGIKDSCLAVEDQVMVGKVIDASNDSIPKALSGCTLKDCELTGLYLQHCTIVGGTIDECLISDAGQQKIYGGTIVNDSVLIGAVLDGQVRVMDCSLTKVRATGPLVCLSDCSGLNCYFTGCTIKGEESCYTDGIMERVLVKDEDIDHSKAFVNVRKSLE